MSSQVYILSLSPCVIDCHATARCGRSQNFANTPWAACLKPVNRKCPHNFTKLYYPGTLNLCTEYDIVRCLLTPVINLQVINIVFFKKSYLCLLLFPVPYKSIPHCKGKLNFQKKKIISVSGKP